MTAPQHQTTSALKEYLPFWTSFAASLCGAFFGALGAYFFVRRVQRRDEKNRRHAALLATQYAFFSQWHVVEDIRHSLLDPHRRDPMRHIRIGSYFQPEADSAIPFKDLTFIIDSDETNLLQEIHLVERSYQNVLRLLERRNKLHEDFENRFPPIIANPDAGTAKVSPPTHELVRLQNATDKLYEAVDHALPKFDEEIKKIHKYVKRNFRWKRAITGITAAEKFSHANLTRRFH